MNSPITGKEIARLAVTIAVKGVRLPTSLKIIKPVILAVVLQLFPIKRKNRKRKKEREETRKKRKKENERLFVGL
jgi:hypothetical protein